MNTAGTDDKRGSMQGSRLGSYELLKRLGEGGMAQVFLARDVRLGREVAVKVLDHHLAERTGFRQRFLREAQLAAALDHPNIVQLYDFGEGGDDNSVLFLVMPYLSGGSLQDALSRTPFAVNQVVTYGTQLADALEYAHQKGVVHRDVKPANVLLHADGRAMLGDFGLAKILDGAPRPASREGRPDAGTPEYMAPEQIQGRTDGRSDIYGLGVVLYLLLTGRLPFTGANSNAVMEGHLYRLPEPLRRLNPAVTPAVEGVVMRALAKQPEDRFQKAGELGAALLSALVAGDAEPLPFATGLPSSSATSRPPLFPSEPSQTTGAMFMSAPEPPRPAPNAQPHSATSILPSLNVPQAYPGPSRPPTSGASFAGHTHSGPTSLFATERMPSGPSNGAPSAAGFLFPLGGPSGAGHQPSTPGEVGRAQASTPHAMFGYDGPSQTTGFNRADAMSAPMPPMSIGMASPRSTARPPIHTEAMPALHGRQNRRLWVTIAVLLAVMLLAAGILSWALWFN